MHRLTHEQTHPKQNACSTEGFRWHRHKTTPPLMEQQTTEHLQQWEHT